MPKNYHVKSYEKRDCIFTFFLQKQQQQQQQQQHHIHRWIDRCKPRKRRCWHIHFEGALGTVVRKESVATGKFCSSISYTGECVAFLRALEWIQQQEQIRGGPLNIPVSSDSMSLVQSLKSNNWKDGDTYLKQIKQVLYNLNSIIILWIPSHCDIPGNEQADELAKKGSMKN